MTSVIESRQRLDKTLLSPALTDAPILSNLVRKQLQNSSPGLVLFFRVPSLHLDPPSYRQSCYIESVDVGVSLELRFLSARA
jgi:hypothetical protein